MLEMKELNRPPTAGVGQAVDLRTTLKIHKETLKTRAFQEACIFSVVELAEHLAQWSYSVAFFELSFIPLVRLWSFCKSTKVERFHREMKQLSFTSCEFTNKRHMDITFAPNDPAVASFLKAEKESKASPLSQYVATLRARAQERNDSMVESSVLVGAESSMFGSTISEVEENENETDNVEGTGIFSSSWLPGRNSAKKAKWSKKQSQKEQHHVGPDVDVVEDLVVSSDEGESMSDSPSIEDGGHEMTRSAPSKQGRNNRKLSTSSKKRKWPRARKAARKNTN